MTAPAPNRGRTRRPVGLPGPRLRRGVGEVDASGETGHPPAPVEWWCHTPLWEEPDARVVGSPQRGPSGPRGVGL